MMGICWATTRDCPDRNVLFSNEGHMLGNHKGGIAPIDVSVWAIPCGCPKIKMIFTFNPFDLSILFGGLGGGC